MWRSRIFWRLAGAYGVLLTLALGLLGWLLIQRIQTHLLDEIRDNLATKTILVTELVAGENRDQLQSHMAQLSQETRARITIIAADGIVLADSAERPEQMENHRDRPEVREAAASGIGVATRFSGTVHEPMMYVARRQDGQNARYVRLALPLDRVYAEIRWLAQVVWTGAGVTLLLSLGLSLLIARRQVRPLVELADAAGSIAQGDFGKRVLLNSSDEVGALAASFNAMSQACALHIHQIERDRAQLRAILASMVEGVLVLDGERNIQFLNDAAGKMLGVLASAVQGKKIWQLFRHRQLGQFVDRVVASEEAVACELEWPGAERQTLAVHGARLPQLAAIAGEQSDLDAAGAVLVIHDISSLRKLERIREDFVANVSHELKTPLAAIQAGVETLLDGALQDPEHNVRFLERIRENAERLHRLVQDLLSLGRIESGAEVLELQSIPLHEAVAACLTNQADRAKTKNLQLVEAAPTDPVQVLADEGALSEILDNLVDNAIKYTPAGGTITLRWAGDNGEAVLQVEDTGVGIPAKDLPRIFERFYRVDKARSRELGGTGLGLSIVKHLVGALGGSIAATSQLGSGTTFTVRLRRSNA